MQWYRCSFTFMPDGELRLPDTLEIYTHLFKAVNAQYIDNVSVVPNGPNYEKYDQLTLDV